MYGESIAALIDALRRSPNFVERLLDDVIPVVDEQASPGRRARRRVYEGAIRALRQALLVRRRRRGRSHRRLRGLRP